MDPTGTFRRRSPRTGTPNAVALNVGGVALVAAGPVVPDVAVGPLTETPACTGAVPVEPTVTSVLDPATSTEPPAEGAPSPVAGEPLGVEPFALAFPLPGWPCPPASVVASRATVAGVAGLSTDRTPVFAPAE